MPNRPLHPFPRRAPLPGIAAALVVAVVAVVAIGSTPAARKTAPASSAAPKDTIGRVVRTDAQWRKQLTPEQYRVLRQKGTERAFTGATWDEHRPGTYACAGCALPLFDAAKKYDSGTGWPSFWAPLDPRHVREVPDYSYGGVNTEIVCARCDGHLGHVFDDGPKPTGLRYCMNSAAMTFRPRK